MLVADAEDIKTGILILGKLKVTDTLKKGCQELATLGNSAAKSRVIGSEANCASAMIVLNTAVAEALTDFKKRVDALIAKGEDKTSAIIDIVRQDIKACKPIRFDDTKSIMSRRLLRVRVGRTESGIAENTSFISAAVSDTALKVRNKLNIIFFI